jgi:hypothetical protein
LGHVLTAPGFVALDATLPSAGHAEVFQMSVQEPSSSGDLDPCPVTDAPGASTGTTPSIVKGPITALETLEPA